jgi:hypothetical protein
MGCTRGRWEHAWNEWVLITTCKQLVWSNRIVRNMSIWNLCLRIRSGEENPLGMIHGHRYLGVPDPRRTETERSGNQYRSRRPCMMPICCCIPLLTSILQLVLRASLDFLKSYLSIRNYSRCVSRQGGHRPLSLPPSTSQAPSLEEHIAKGQEEKGR